VDPDSRQECAQSIGIASADRKNPALLEHVKPGSPDMTVSYAWNGYEEEYLRRGRELTLPIGTVMPTLDRPAGVIDSKSGECIDPYYYQGGLGQNDADSNGYCLWEGFWLDAARRDNVEDMNRGLEAMRAFQQTWTWENAWDVSVHDYLTESWSKAALGDGSMLATNFELACAQVHDQFVGWDD